MIFYILMHKYLYGYEIDFLEKCNPKYKTLR